MEKNGGKMEKGRFFGKEVQTLREYLNHVEERVEQFGAYQTTLNNVRKAVMLDRGGRPRSRGAGVKNPLQLLRKKCEKRALSFNRVENWIVFRKDETSS